MEFYSFKGYSNNVGFIKFIAATAVIISHSFPLYFGNNDREWLYRYTFGQATLGRVAVWIFFFYSGLLVTKSLMNKKNEETFLIDRLKRLFPPLLFVIVCSTFVLGPIVSNLSIGQYFSNINTWKYLLNGVFIPIHNLPGVFEKNIYPNVVNGALWTMPVELICYFVCLMMYKLELLNEKKMPLLGIISILVILMITFIFWNLNLDVFVSAGLACLSFFTGMYVFVMRNRISIKLNYKTIFLIILMFLISNYYHFLFVSMYIIFPLLLVNLGFGIKQLPKFLGKLGNYSFGMYLCGFPTQQTVYYLFGLHLNFPTFIIINIALSLFFGWIVYFVVEYKFTNWIDRKL